MDSRTSFGFSHPSILNEITKSCEKLVTETQCDLEIFRNEQEALQQKLLEIQKENSHIKSKLEVLKSATANAAIGESRDDATREKLTNDAFQNVKAQLDYLQTENQDLRSLNKNFQNTIGCLEKEIQKYRNQLFNPTSASEIKQKYATAIKLLESTIVSQKSNLRDQMQITENLLEQKRQFKTHIEKLESSIEEKNKELSKCAESNNTIKKLEEQLKESIQHNKELQKSLKIAKQSVDERFKREQQSLKKVQEALNIADAAVAGKEEALRREKMIKEDFQNISSTIGQVMDEAARKVEQDMEAMRKKLIDKEKSMTEEKNKMCEEMQNQNKLNQMLNTRCKGFEEKYKEVVKEKEKLAQQLQFATKSIYEMEQTLIQQESLHKSNQHIGKQSDEQEMEIKRYVAANKQLKDRYRLILNDITKSFELKMSLLQTEVLNLKAENQILKHRNSRGND